MRKYGINYLGIEEYLHDIREALWRYGISVDDSFRYTECLAWYTNTGRASTGFLKHLVNTKPYRIARVLLRVKADTAAYDAIITEVSKKTGFTK